MLLNEPFFLVSETIPDYACLMLHGLGGGIYELQLLAERLHQQGLTLQGFNYPGHDRPSGRMPHSTWSDWYGRIADYYEKLAQRYTNISLIGFSTGCPLGLHLASQYPVHKLVLLSPFLALRHRWYYGFRPEQYAKTLGKWIQDVPRFALPIRDRDLRQQAEAVAFFQSFNVPAVQSALDLIAMVKAEVPQIQVPTLLIQSRQDSIVEPSGAQWLYDHLASSQKELIWLERSDHIIFLDQEREVVFQVVSDFLQPSTISGQRS